MSVGDGKTGWQMIRPLLILVAVIIVIVVIS